MKKLILISLIFLSLNSFGYEPLPFNLMEDNVINFYKEGKNSMLYLLPLLVAVGNKLHSYTNFNVELIQKLYIFKIAVYYMFLFAQKANMIDDIDLNKGISILNFTTYDEQIDEIANMLKEMIKTMEKTK